MSALPSKEDIEKNREAICKELRERVYKCYKCGKTEIGENLDKQWSEGCGLNEGWFFEWTNNEVRRIDQMPPSANFNIITSFSTKAYCDICGKIREREIELLNIEARKVKAYEKIGSGFDYSINIENALADIGSALSDIASELRRFKHLRE